MPEGQQCVASTLTSVPLQPQVGVGVADTKPCVPGLAPLADVAAGVELVQFEVVHAPEPVSQMGLAAGQQCPLLKFVLPVFGQHWVVLPMPKLSVAAQPQVLFVLSQPTVPAAKVVLLAATAAGVLGHVAQAPVLVSHR